MKAVKVIAGTRVEGSGKQAWSLPETWQWPTPPGYLRLVDKHSGRESILSITEEKWTLVHSGEVNYIHFSVGNHGQIQRTVIAHAFGTTYSTGGFLTASKVILRLWSDIIRLLSSGPRALREVWKACDFGPRDGAYIKRVLSVASSFSLGAWAPVYLPIVKSLDTKSGPSRQQSTVAILKRQKLTPLEVQAAITHMLDTADVTQLSERHLEALTALALIFQHGMRPVQVLALGISDVRVFRDVDGEDVCIVSFHMAKQKNGKTLALPRQVKPEWARTVVTLLQLAKQASRRRLFGNSSSAALNLAIRSLCLAHGIGAKFTATSLRHTGAQALADAGHSRKSIQGFLGHAKDQTARYYIEASPNQAELINTALGASKLYGQILSLVKHEFVSVDEVLRADELKQVGAVVGERLVAGVGLCRTGQPSCPSNPVTSCYGCKKFMPALDRAAHEEAIAGIREQVQAYIQLGIAEENPAYRQMTHALAGAQHAVELVDRFAGHSK